MHPAEKELVIELDNLWDTCMQEAFDSIKTKLAVKEGQYEQFSAVWQRFNTAEQFVTMVMLKAHRVESELAPVLLDEHHTWDPDNAVDLIAYTLFLIAYSQFVKTKTVRMAVEDTQEYLYGDCGPPLDPETSRDIIAD